MQDFGKTAGRRQAEEDEAQAPAESYDDVVQDSSPSVNWVDLDQQLRGALKRMASTAERLPPLPEECTFTLAVELKEEGQAPIGVSLASHRATL